MIGYLEGTVLARHEDSVLLRTTGGVGYQVHVPVPLMAELQAADASLRLYVVTVVRDNELALYGFDGLDAKALFELLVKASGVGPKLAMAFLSAFNPAEVRAAIVTQDLALLTTIPGVGRKTATRLCLELGDRLSRHPALIPEWRSGRGDLISALTNLGFPEKDVGLVVRQLSEEGLPFSDQLKKALGLLGRR